MANFKKHVTTGASVGFVLMLISNLIQQEKRRKANASYEFDWSEFALKTIAGAGIGAFCGVLPDLLEPANNPYHRKFFHSITTASAIGVGMLKASQSNLEPGNKELVNLAGACYLSHLLLDSETEFGLPLVA